MKLAIYPGSFDPVTYGHLEIISRASKLFDKLVVLVSVNPSKPSAFSIEERKQLLEEVVKAEGLTNVEIDSHEGLLIDYFNKRNADVIVKGLRALSDFEYEFQMAQANRKLCYKAETIFLTAKSENTYLSSSMVKQIAMFGGDVSDFVPECILDRITTRLKKD
ncbi:MAG: pantetheine-phosphate adenylyltransferase [Ruminococcaceae bacterium]|nr:pantetheine-phosphate adenylyltransferase [Oscillospiraceae bacterium]